MNFNLLVIGTVVVLSSSASADLGCPAATPAALNQWRENLIALALKGDHQAVRENIEKCFGTFSEKHPKCIEDLYDFANQSIYGYSSSQVEWAAASQMILKSENDLPPEFRVVSAQSNAPVPELVRMPKNVLATAEAKGWPAVAYRTRSTGGFDVAPNLVLVAIPEVRPKVDVYLQVSPNPSPQENFYDPHLDPKLVNLDKGQKTLTIITVDRSLNPPQGDMRLMVMDTAHSDENFTAYRWNDVARASKCYHCHTTPLRPISPRGYLTTNPFSNGIEGQLDAKTTAMVEKINKMMNVPGLTWKRVWIDQKMTDGSTRKIQARQGPPMDSPPYGWAPPNSPTRKDDFIKQCISNAEFLSFSGFGNYEVLFSKPANYPNDVRLNVIRQSMNCSGCHNSLYRGVLNEKFSHNELQFKTTVDRSMPPGANLTESERHALLSCVVSEAAEPSVEKAWRQSGNWLRLRACTP